MSFAQMSYTTPEEQMYFTFCLVLSGVVEATQSPVWVDVTSVNGNAEGKQSIVYQNDLFISLW